MDINKDKFVLIVVTLCLVISTLSLLYLEINEVRVPTIINLSVSIACGATISRWLE